MEEVAPAMKLITCDCSCAEPCPQGKTGMGVRCSVWLDGNTEVMPVGTKVVDARRNLTAAAMSASKGHMQTAATSLGVSLKTLYNWRKVKS